MLANFSVAMNFFSRHARVQLQLYTLSGPDTTGEINSAAAVIDWLADGLSSSLPPNVQPNLTSVSFPYHQPIAL
jgi:hypothetical protein